MNVTPTQGGRDALDAAHNQDSGQNSTLQAENKVEDDAESEANNVDVEPDEKVEFSLAEPFHDSPEARHAAFQERKARLLEEAGAGTGRKGKRNACEGKKMQDFLPTSFDRTTGNIHRNFATNKLFSYQGVYGLKLVTSFFGPSGRLVSV